MACEMSHLIVKYDFLKSKISTANVFDNLKKSLLNGQFWEDTIKIEKDKNEFIYLKVKIIKISDASNKNVQEYVFIAYPITDQENEKRIK